MTDQNFHEELRATIRDAIASYLDTCTGEELRELATESLRPAPPTLADMPPQERAACRRMQADVEDDDTRAVPAPALPDGWRLADHPEHGRVLVVRTDGENAIYATTYKATGIRTRICMTSDLEFADAPTGPDHLAVGTVIESADDPRIAALPVGSILVDRDGGAFDITKTDTGEWGGPGYVPSQGTGTKWGPWTVRRIGWEADQ